MEIPAVMDENKTPLVAQVTQDDASLMTTYFDGDKYILANPQTDRYKLVPNRLQPEFSESIVPDKEVVKDCNLELIVSAEYSRVKFPFFVPFLTPYFLSGQGASSVGIQFDDAYSVDNYKVDEVWKNNIAKKLVEENAQVKKERKKKQQPAPKKVTPVGTSASTRGFVYTGVRTVNVAYAHFGPNKLDVTLESLKHLKKDEELNDLILNYGMAVMFQHLQLNPQIVTLMTTYNFQSIFTKDLNPRAVDNWYKTLTRKGKKNLLDNRYILLPVGREGHWYLMVICNPFPTQELVNEKDALISQIPADRTDAEKKKLSLMFDLYYSWMTGRTAGPPMIFILDSLLDRCLSRVENYLAFHRENFEYVTRVLLAVHNLYWEKTERPYFKPIHNMRDATYGQPEILKMPQQPNRSDCGLFVLEYVRMFFDALKKCNGDHLMAKVYNFRADEDAAVRAACSLRTFLENRIEQDCAKQFPHLLEAVKNELRKEDTLTSIKLEINDDEEYRDPPAPIHMMENMQLNDFQQNLPNIEAPVPMTSVEISLEALFLGEKE